MQRRLTDLQDRLFDVVVVGGGASGAAIARECALRGLGTALVERDDFGGGTSAHCFKVMHGGIRYLQHLDIPRIRSSCRERSGWLRIAPHLVEPLPFAVPTYGQGRSSKWFLGTGMLAYDAITADLNRAIPDPGRRVAGTRFLSRHETLSSFPWLEAKSLTGAAVFEDGQMYSPPRLVVALAQAAEERGAVVANHVEATGFLIEEKRVTGITARDRLGGDEFPVRARVVINAAGPWAEGLLQQLPSSSPGRLGSFSRDTCFVINRSLGTRLAIAVQGQSRDADALLARSARHMFLVPWRDCTLVGVWHGIVPTDPDSSSLPREQLRTFLEEINYCYPALSISEQDVVMSGFGLVPFGDPARQGGNTLSFGKESRFIDHRLSDGLSGLITCVSVRYTVARSDAEQVLDLVSQQIPVPQANQLSLTLPLPGGDLASVAGFTAQQQRDRPAWMSAAAVDALVRNLGSHASAVLARAKQQPAAAAMVAGTDTTVAQVDHAIDVEMAQTLADVLFRRTDIGTAKMPSDAAIAQVHAHMASRLQWSVDRQRKELAAVEAHAVRYLAAG